MAKQFTVQWVVLDNLAHRSHTYNKQEGTTMDTHTTQYKISVMQAAQDVSKGVW